MPGDGLALTVGVGGEVQLVGILEQALELGDLRLLLRADDVQRLEVVVDVHTEARPRLTLVLRGHVRSASREVANVADRRLHHVILPEVGRDLLGLRR